MGRKKTPTKLRLIMGNPGKQPIPKNEVEPPPGMPEIPKHLCEDARAEWERVCHGLNAMGVLTVVDKAVLAAYCTSYALWERSWRAINEMAKTGKLGAGLMISTTNGNLIQNPLVGSANKGAKDMISYASELGMTPVARTRIRTGPAVKTALDKYLK